MTQTQATDDDDRLDSWADDVLPRLHDLRAAVENMSGEAPPPDASDVKSRAKSQIPKRRAKSKSNAMPTSPSPNKASSLSAKRQGQDRVFSSVQLRVIHQREQQLNEAKSFIEAASEATMMVGNSAGKLSACKNRIDAKIVDGTTERILTTPNTREVATKHGSTIDDLGAREHHNLEQIAYHMLYLELLEESMASQDYSYFSRSVAGARANGSPSSTLGVPCRSDSARSARLHKRGEYQRCHRCRR